MPILTLVVPRLVSDALHWRLEGRHNARQCLLTRGLLPMLAAPQPHGDAVLEEAIAIASRMGVIKAHDHVVVVQRVHEDFCVKIVSVDGVGAGIKRLALGGREATPDDDDHVSRTMLVSTMSSRMTLLDGKALPSMCLRP
jgi:hypothetical protein